MLEGEGSNQGLSDNAGAVQQMDAADAALERTVDEALGNEAPAEQTSAPAETAGPAANAPAAQPRDPKGRFTQQAPSAESPPDAEAPTQAPDAEGEPTAEAAGELAPGEQPSDAAAPEAEYPEASYQYEGKDVTIPGSAVGENGAFVKSEQWQNEILPLLALGRSAREGSIRQQLRSHGHEAQRWKTAIDSAVASRDEIFNAISAMVEAEQKGDTERGFQKWADNLLQNWEILKAQALLKGKDVELAEERRQREGFEQEQERGRREPQMEAVLKNAVAHYGQLEKLSPEARTALLERLSAPRYRQQIFTIATQDDPAAGIKRGQWVVNYDVIEDEVKFFVRASGGQAATAERVQQLQKENAQRTGKQSNAPPVATAKRGAAPAPVGKLPDSVKTAEDADSYIWDKGGYKNLG